MASQGTMPAPLPLTLSPSAIDDLLYSARTGDLTDLTAQASSLTLTLPGHPTEKAIFTLCIDPDTGNTPLHMAAANNHVSILEHLITMLKDADADAESFADRQNDAGNTAVHYAAMNGQRDAVKVLVERGNADVRIINRAGRDALEEAETGGKEEAAEYLARLGASSKDADADGDGEVEDGGQNIKAGDDGMADEADGGGLVDEMQNTTLK